MVVRTMIVLGVLCCLLGTVPVAASSLSFGTELSGMGGAGVALTKDVYAAVYNPAGLARVKRFSIEPNLTFYTDKPTVLEDFANYTAGDSGLPPETVRLETGAMVGFATPRFALNMAGQALGVTNPGSDELVNQAGAAMVYNSKLSMAVPIPLWGHSVSIGTTFNYFSAHRYEAQLVGEWDEVSFAQTYAGAGRSFDVGTQVDLLGNLRLGMVARNISGAFEWDQDDLVSQVQPITPSYQAGIGWDGQTFRAALDWEWAEDDLRRYRIGLAKDFWRLFTIRVGGIIEPDEELTYTGGLSFRLGVFSLNMAAAKQDEAWNATVSMALNM